MNRPRTQRKKILASLIGAAFGAVLMPSIAVASEADLMRKIDALQQELQALKAQVNAAPAASSGGGGGGGVSAPAGFEMSIYGRGHVSGDRVDDGVHSHSYVHSSSSRLGFKGSQDLGDGNAVIFQFETGVDVTNNGTGDGNPGGSSLGGGGLFTGARDTFVGLRNSKLGTVTFGRQSAIESWLYDYNLFGDQVGDLGNIWGDLPGRFNNSIKYAMPTMNGFNAAVTYAPDQGTNSRDNILTKVDYATGGFKVGAAYAIFGGGVGAADNDVGALTASYSTSQWSVGGGWQYESDVGNIRNAKQDKYTIGASYNIFSKGTVKAQYAYADDIHNAPGTGAKQWAIGYDYAWRPDTTVYVTYSHTSNDAAAGYRADNWGHGTNGVAGPVAGTNPEALSLGLVYKFDIGLFGKR